MSYWFQHRRRLRFQVIRLRPFSTSIDNRALWLEKETTASGKQPLNDAKKNQRNYANTIITVRGKKGDCDCDGHNCLKNFTPCVHL